jgi:S-adenosylmethionine synthetase
MDLRISSFQEALDVEVVERKGIGHPDSLADILAESFSNDYSLYCLENFGTVLNYWFDKVTLSGGVCSLDFGKCDVLKPVTIYLFGRITTSFGEHQIPYEDLFKRLVLVYLRKFLEITLRKSFYFSILM